MAHIVFVFCCVVWGSMFIVLERVTHTMGAVEIALWRFGGGTAVLGIIWWYAYRHYRPSRGELLGAFLVAVAFTVPPQIILPYLIGQGFGHSFFGTMVAPIPLLTILASIPLLGVLPTKRQLIGVLGGLGCVWLLVDDGFDRGMSLGLIALTLSIPASSALSNTIIKRNLSRVPAVPLTAMLLAAAGLALAPLEFAPATLDALHLATPNSSPPVEASLLTWVYLFILAVVATGISTAAFVWMILKRGPLFAGMTTYVVPVISLLWGTVDRERISPQQLLAIAGVLSMVALVQWESRSASVAVELAVPTQPMTGPEAIADALAPLPLAADPQLAVVPAELARPLSSLSQPESQVA